MSREVSKGLKLTEIESQVWNGFKNIFVMSDHGGGQTMVLLVTLSETPVAYLLFDQLTARRISPSLAGSPLPSE